MNFMNLSISNLFCELSVSLQTFLSVRFTFMSEKKADFHPNGCADNIKMMGVYHRVGKRCLRLVRLDPAPFHQG